MRELHTVSESKHIIKAIHTALAICASSASLLGASVVTQIGHTPPAVSHNPRTDCITYEGVSNYPVHPTGQVVHEHKLKTPSTLSYSVS